MANEIHPTAILDHNVKLGRGNTIGAYSVLRGAIMIGDDNLIGPHASIGGFADEIQRRRPSTQGKRIAFGSRCLIREFVSVHMPCYAERTLIGDDVYLMHGAYVGHDTEVEHRAILAQASAIGGLARVLEGAYVAMGAAVLQRVVVGQYSIVAANAAAARCVRPFSRYIPGQATSVNTYALDRYGLTEYACEIDAYVLEGRRPTSGEIRTRVEHYEQLRDQTGIGEYW